MPMVDQGLRRLSRGTNLALPIVVKGRITEKHLGQAERTFPGIGELYASLDDKPATFLQLVWLYEGLLAELDSVLLAPQTPQSATA